MIFEQVRTGGDRNFGYFIADKAGGCAAVIDPSGAPELFSDLLERHHCTLKYVILTHSHFDHTGGSRTLASKSSALIVTSDSAAREAGRPVEKPAMREGWTDEHGSDNE